MRLCCARNRACASTAIFPHRSFSGSCANVRRGGRGKTCFWPCADRHHRLVSDLPTDRRTVFATDHTNACRTLLYDLRKLHWDEELCRWWQVPRDALAEIRASDACFGETTLDGKLSRAVPIRGVMGDFHAAMFAQQCLTVGSAKVTFGTGSSVLMNAGSASPRGLQAPRSVALAWVRGELCLPTRWKASSRALPRR